jgi:hypothetical protein
MQHLCYYMAVKQGSVTLEKKTQITYMCLLEMCEVSREQIEYGFKLQTSN